MPNDEALQSALSALGAANAAVCAGIIREMQQKHEDELSTLRAQYETELKLRSTCGPCANSPPLSSAGSGPLQLSTTTSAGSPSQQTLQLRAGQSVARRRESNASTL